jgi:hypothetical protein
MSVNSEVEHRVTALNAGWYNHLSKVLKQDQGTFLLAQGTLGLSVLDSSGLFRISDAVPPSASVAYFDAGMQSRADSYRMLLSALLPEGGSGLRVALMDKYPKWVEYRERWADDPTTKGTQQEAFEAWANKRLDPDAREAALSAYLLAANSPLNHALEALKAPGARQQFLTSDDTPYWLYVYSATAKGAQEAIARGASATLAFDSSTMDTSLAHTTAKGSASGFYDIFSASAAASFEQLDTMAAASDFRISGSIGKYATLPTGPIGWLSPAEVKRARDARNDASVWDPMAHAGGWGSFFGQPDGSLARYVSQMLLLSDYEIVVKSSAKYSAEQYRRITAEVSGGIWPFFSASAKAVHETRYRQEADGSLTVTYTLPKGLIQIWGVTVDAMN